MKRILNKIRLLSGYKRRPKFDELKEKGFLKIGTGCDLSAMTAIIIERHPGNINIEMGNNCCVRGTIMVYRAASKVTLGDNVYIGPGSFIECVDSITIGSNVLISMNCNIIDTNSHSLHSAERIQDTVDWQKGLAHKNWNVVDTRKVSIGDHCWLGLRSMVLKGVTLGNGSIVAAGSVVVKDTEPFSLVGGNPAKLIRQVD